MEWYYCYDGQTIEGPVDLDELKQLAADGMLPPHTVVAPEGSQEWQSLEAVLSPPSAIPPPLPIPPLLPQPAPATPNSPSIVARFKTWFSGLEPRGKFAVVGTALVVLVVLFYPSGSSSHESDGISDAEGAAIVDRLVSSVPNNQNTCSACGGSGQVANTFFSGGCKTCRGRGTILTRSGYETSCPTCGGTGNAKSTTCDRCGGKGYTWGY